MWLFCPKEEKAHQARDSCLQVSEELSQGEEV